MGSAEKNILLIMSLIFAVLLFEKKEEKVSLAFIPIDFIFL